MRTLRTPLARAVTPMRTDGSSWLLSSGRNSVNNRQKKGIAVKKRFRAVLLSLGFLFLLAQPAFAAELGEPNITPQTTMRELRKTHH